MLLYQSKDRIRKKSCVVHSSNSETTPKTALKFTRVQVRGIKQEMAVSLEYYHNLVLLINYIVYGSYLSIKYIVAPLLWLLLKWWKKSRMIIQFMQFTILLIFGKQLRIKKHADQKDSYKILNMTLHERQLGYWATIVLFVLIATFGVLAVGSALDLTLLSVTHICSEDTQIDCYPQLIRGANDTGLNISISEPIQDCSFWNSEGVSDRVTFMCYQFVYDVKLFLAVIGGLLVFFIYTTKITIAVLLFLNVCCLGRTCTRCFPCRCSLPHYRLCGPIARRCKSCLCMNRFLVAFIASIIEIALAISYLVLGVTGNTVVGTNDSPELIIVVTHALEVLVVFGIIATLLWLPWEDYVSKPPEYEEPAYTSDVTDMEDVEPEEESLA